MVRQYYQVILILTVKVGPDEDPMSLKYVWCLTAPERQVLTRIAKGRCGRARAKRRGPAHWTARARARETRRL